MSEYVRLELDISGHARTVAACPLIHCNYVIFIYILILFLASGIPQHNVFSHPLKSV